jgi:hypothetical protein
MYTAEELAQIVRRSARILQTPIEEPAVEEIAKRSRGTPRIANRLLRRIRDFAQVLGTGVITLEITQDALQRLGVDPLGLDEMDHKILRTLIEKFGGGPVGLDTLAAAIQEDAGTIEDMYEPYLMQLGFLQRTARGRMATPRAYAHLGVASDWTCTSAAAGHHLAAEPLPLNLFVPLRVDNHLLLVYLTVELHLVGELHVDLLSKEAHRRLNRRLMLQNHCVGRGVWLGAACRPAALPCHLGTESGASDLQAHTSARVA